MDAERVVERDVIPVLEEDSIGVRSAEVLECAALFSSSRESGIIEEVAEGSDNVVWQGGCNAVEDRLSWRLGGERVYGRRGTRRYGCWEVG